MSDRATAELDLLREALVVALRTSQRRAGPGDAEPPAGLAPFRTFTRFPPRALAVARDALDDDAFRERVAAVVGTDDTVVGAAGGLFLRRPDGWRDDLDRLVDAKLAEDDVHEDRTARRELERANELIEQLTERIAEGERRERELRVELDAALGHLGDRDGELVASRSEVAELTEARNTAVRQLKDVERRLQDAHRRLRESDVPADASSELRAEESALERDAAELDELRARLAADLRRQRDVIVAAVDDAIHVVEAAPEGASADGAAEAPARREAPGAARRAMRIGRGIAEDSVEAVELLFGLAGMDVLIDGYNVAFAAWPAMSPAEGRELLVGRLEALAPVTRARVTVVFDGVDRGTGTVFGRGSSVRVRFTDEGVEADDEILALVEGVPGDRGVTVVSDDRRVVDGARARGANVVRSTTLIELFRR